MIESVPLPILALLVFLPVFSLIVVVHEGGHFWAARACGVTVEAFSIGFGPALVKWTDKRGTEWRISAIPLGGYVKFLGDANAASTPDREELARLRYEFEREHGEGSASGCFHFKPVWQRAIVVVAGPFMNFVLAVVLFAGLYMTVGEAYRPAVVAEVTENGAAKEAGILPGDIIRSINGGKVRGVRDIRELVALQSGQTVSVVVERNGEDLRLDAHIQRASEEISVANRPVSLGELGILVREDQVFVRYGPFGALAEGVERTQRTIVSSWIFLSRLVTGKESINALTGPLGMGQLAGMGAEATIDDGKQQGQNFGQIAINVTVFALQLAAFLSISVGFINLLPIPMLDGGHLMYYAYEAATGRPLGEAAQEWGYRIGLALVLGFMLFVTLNDVRWLGAFGGALSGTS